MPLVNLLVVILVFGIVFSIIWYIITIIPMLQPFRNAALAILGLIAIIILLSMLFGGVPLPRIMVG